MPHQTDGGPIRLAPTARRAIVSHARAEAPRECCGLLIGAGSVVDEAVPVRNVHPAPATRYLIDPAAHIAAVRCLRGTPRSILGCYHSHPRTAAVPSSTDLAEALYPDYVWIIVSLASPESPQLAAYRFTRGAAERLTLLTEQD